MPNRAVILSVDDDEGLQVVVTHYLEGEGYKTLSATSGKDVLEILKNNTPHLILLDLVLPDTDGISLLAQLRALKKFRSLWSAARATRRKKLSVWKWARTII